MAFIGAKWKPLTEGAGGSGAGFGQEGQENSFSAGIKEGVMFGSSVREREMKSVLLLCAVGMCFPIPASNPEGGMVFSYQLGKPRRVDLRKIVSCASVSSATLREEDFARAFGENTLVAQVNRTTSKLEPVMARDGLMVQGEDKTGETFKVTSDRELFLAAVFSNRQVPAVKSILIDKEEGHATLTTDERKHSGSVFFVCD